MTTQFKGQKPTKLLESTHPLRYGSLIRKEETPKERFLFGVVTAVGLATVLAIGYNQHAHAQRDAGASVTVHKIGGTAASVKETASKILRK